jgi:hypothetical protein
MIYKLPLQLFRILLVFEINRLVLIKSSVHSAILDHSAFDMHTSQVG